MQQSSLSSLTELVSICREEWEKLPKYRCAKLVASFPRLDAVIVAKVSGMPFQVKLKLFCSYNFKNKFLGACKAISKWVNWDMIKELIG